MTISRRIRSALALTVDNWLSRCYLGAVALATGFALYDQLFVDHADASFAFVAPLFLTAPLSLLLVALPGGAVTGYLAIAAGALANAAVLGAVLRGLRRPSARTAPGT
jgi:hypothetical protein